MEKRSRNSAALFKTGLTSYQAPGVVYVEQGTDVGGRSRVAAELPQTRV